MWRKKRFIIPGIIAAVVAASLGGVAFAQSESGDDGQPGAVLDRVCEIYEENTGVAIDSEALRDAFAQVNVTKDAYVLYIRGYPDRSVVDSRDLPLACLATSIASSCSRLRCVVLRHESMRLMS